MYTNGISFPRSTVTLDLITEIAAEILQIAYTMCRHWTKGLFMSWAGQNRKHLTPQNGTQLKYELFISGDFHLIFLGHNLLEVWLNLQKEKLHVKENNCNLFAGVRLLITKAAAIFSIKHSVCAWRESWNATCAVSCIPHSNPVIWHLPCLPSHPPVNT